MERTVEQRHLDVDHGIAGKNAALHGLLGARVNRRDVLARDASAGDLVRPLDAGTDRERFEDHLHFGKLA